MEPDNFDTSWIEEQEKMQDIHQNIAKENQTSINIFYVYVNKNNDVDKITHEKHSLATKSSRITKENLLGIIQCKKIYTPFSKYKFEDVILYSVEIDPENIQSYISTEADPQQSPYSKVLPFIGDIVIPETVFIFHDINCLFFIFKEYEFQKTHKTTLKSILKPSGEGGEHNIKHTKKVRIQVSPEDFYSNTSKKNRKTRKLKLIMKHMPILENSAV